MKFRTERSGWGGAEPVDPTFYGVVTDDCRAMIGRRLGRLYDVRTEPSADMRALIGAAARNSIEAGETEADTFATARRP